MAYDIAMDMSTGDLVLQNSDLLLIDNVERVAQQITITLRFWRGEWFLATADGVPYLEYILVKNPNANHIRQILIDKIMSVDGVQQVTDMDLNFDTHNRRLSVSYAAQTTYGLVTKREVLGYGRG